MDISNRYLCVWSGFKSEIFTGDFSPDNTKVSFAGAEGLVRIYSIDIKE